MLFKNQDHSSARFKIIILHGTQPLNHKSIYILNVGFFLSNCATYVFGPNLNVYAHLNCAKLTDWKGVCIADTMFKYSICLNGLENTLTCLHMTQKVFK